MVRLDQDIMRAHIQRCDDQGLSADARGDAFEDLTCYILGTVPGLTIMMRDKVDVFDARETDIAVWNDRNAEGLPSLIFPDLFLVECKNLSRRMSSQDVSWFKEKLENGGFNFGIMTTMIGVTGDSHERTSAHQIVFNALQAGRHIIVLQRQDIEGLADTSELVRTIKQRVTELKVRGSSL